MLCLLIGFIQPIPIKKGITLIIATDAIELNLTAIQLLMVIIADAIELIALMLMLPIKRITHKLMLKCLAEIIEPMRGWLIGYGSLISAFGTFPMVSHWKSYELPLENHSFWLKISMWNLMICHWKSFHLMMLTNGPHPAYPNQRGHCTHAAHQEDHP